MKAIHIATIRDPELKLSAELLDRTVAGDEDGRITSSEVDRALEVADSDPRLRDAPEVKKNLMRLKSYLERFGSDAGARPNPTRLGTGNLYNALGLQLAALGSRDKTPTLLLKDGEMSNSVEHLFELPYDKRKVRDGQAVLVPLEARALFSIEVEYQDTRKLRDLELSGRQPGDYDWQPFRGDAWFDKVEEESYGNVEIHRDPETDAPLLNNPVVVEIDILFPDGRVFEVGKKAIRFNLDDAFDGDSSGYPTTDTFDDELFRLPNVELPAGCMLRVTPSFADKKPWEKLRNIAANVAWIKPVYEP